MKPLYVPKGKAKEYGDYAVNIYTGCPHRCYYCFACWKQAAAAPARLDMAVRSNPSSENIGTKWENIMYDLTFLA